MAGARVPRAILICADAAQMLPLERMDVAVAHLSFLSTARLRDAFGHIHNALLPGGLLTFVIEDPTAPQSVIAMLLPLMRALHERYPRVNLAVPERDGVENEVTLRALLKATGFTGAVDVEHLVLSAHLTLDEIIEFAFHSYPFGLLNENAQAELRECLRASLSHANGEATLVKLPLKLVTARRDNAI
jgi:SAM-dependent methyltransferase